MLGCCSTWAGDRCYPSSVVMILDMGRKLLSPSTSFGHMFLNGRCELLRMMRVTPGA